MKGIRETTRDVIDLCERHYQRLMREQEISKTAREELRRVHGPIPTPCYALGEPGTGRILNDERFPDYEQALTAAGRVGAIVVRAKPIQPSSPPAAAPQEGQPQPPFSQSS